MSTTRLFLLAVILGCGEQPAAAPTEIAPIHLEDATCDACGMVVLEQPAPRAQVRHRDGTIVALCSLGDLRAHVQTPSPHGKPADIWVEALPPDFDPRSSSAAPELPWIRAEDAWFVVGFERPGTMGRPALSYATEDAAAAAAARVGGRTARWSALADTLFSKDP
jgi:copper chaperone NosL